MSNIDRAAEVIGPVMSRWDMAGRPDMEEGIDRHLAIALDDAGRLIPDLPKPRSGGTWEGKWGVWVVSLLRGGARVRVDDDLTLDEVRELALALLAATDYAEGARGV